MKAPSPACFATWEEHRVATHDEWLKRTKDVAVMVQRFGASWGYLLVRLVDSRWTVVSGEFDFDWTAMDACEKAETAWAEATKGTEGVA